MKNICKFAAAFCLTTVILAGLTVFAAPVDNLPMSVTQPNGDEITLYFSGDEIYSYMCDSDGNIVVENDNGFYVYAVLSDGEITPTDFVVQSTQGGSSAGGATAFLTQEDIPEDIVKNAYLNSRFSNSENESNSRAIKYSDKDFNGLEINNIVVFINFNDTTYTKNRLDYYDELFNTASDSAKKYYEEVSYGKVGMKSLFFPKMTSSLIKTYNDPNNASYYSAANYNYDYNIQCEREQAMFKRALEYVKEDIGEDIDLDKNNDGYIDMITFVLPGNIMSGSNQVRWPHQWSFTDEYSVEINGAVSDMYNVQIEGALRGKSADDGTTTFQTASAIICHETLHILGFPDMYYYNFNYPTSKVSLGKWDIMCSSNGAHPSAYMKNVYGGWLDIEEVSETGSYVLKSLQSENCALKIRVPKSENEYFIVEYRNKDGNFEKNAPLQSVVIYRALADHKGRGNWNANVSDGTDDELTFIERRTSGSVYLDLSSGVYSGIKVSVISIGDNSAAVKVTFDTNLNLGYFRDKNLSNAICETLGKDEEDVTNEDLTSLTSLAISGKDKQEFDLSGIENLTSLKNLSLTDCGIGDISYLQNLTQLESLNLTNNFINDISALTNLTNLKSLYLRGNLIDDYLPTASYYANLTQKDFSLENKTDAVIFAPEAGAESIGDCVIKCTNYVPSGMCCVIEMRDKVTNKLLSKKTNRFFTNLAGSIKTIEVPYKIKDTENTYIAVKAYENKSYRHVMSETKIDSICVDFELFN